MASERTGRYPHLLQPCEVSAQESRKMRSKLEARRRKIDGDDFEPVAEPDAGEEGRISGDLDAASKYKTEVDTKIVRLETEAKALSGKANKKARAEKNKTVATLKSQQEYLDACRIVSEARVAEERRQDRHRGAGADDKGGAEACETKAASEAEAKHLEGAGADDEGGAEARAAAGAAGGAEPCEGIHRRRTRQRACAEPAAGAGAGAGASAASSSSSAYQQRTMQQQSQMPVQVASVPQGQMVRERSGGLLAAQAGDSPVHKVARTSGQPGEEAAEDSATTRASVSSADPCPQRPKQVADAASVAVDAEAVVLVGSDEDISASERVEVAVSAGTIGAEAEQECCAVGANSVEFDVELVQETLSMEEEAAAAAAGELVDAWKEAFAVQEAVAATAAAAEATAKQGAPEEALAVEEAVVATAAIATEGASAEQDVSTPSASVAAEAPAKEAESSACSEDAGSGSNLLSASCSDTCAGSSTDDNAPEPQGGLGMDWFMVTDDDTLMFLANGTPKNSKIALQAGARRALNAFITTVESKANFIKNKALRSNRASAAVALPAATILEPAEPSADSKELAAPSAPREPSTQEDQDDIPFLPTASDSEEDSGGSSSSTASSNPSLDNWYRLTENEAHDIWKSVWERKNGRPNLPEVAAAGARRGRRALAGFVRTVDTKSQDLRNKARRAFVVVVSPTTSPITDGSQRRESMLFIQEDKKTLDEKLRSGSNCLTWFFLLMSMGRSQANAHGNSPVKNAASPGGSPTSPMAAVCGEGSRGRASSENRSELLLGETDDESMDRPLFHGAQQNIKRSQSITESLGALRRSLSAKADAFKAAAPEVWRDVCETKRRALEDSRQSVDELRNRVRISLTPRPGRVGQSSTPLGPCLQQPATSVGISPSGAAAPIASVISPSGADAAVHWGQDSW